MFRILFYNSLAPPELRVVASKRNITSEEFALLSCTARSQNGPTPAGVLEWVKNSLTVSETTAAEDMATVTLNTSTLSNPYGRYFCRVSNIAPVVMEAVLISEKGIVKKWTCVRRD